jgi:4-hydroxy-3-methylbut-2-en-1-yl diphosphate reductase
MDILLANPRGFCAGVDRAIEIVERALEEFGAPIHVRHEVVHNRSVVQRLSDLGAVFVDELDQVPDGGIVIFSAHGVSRAVEQEAARRELQVFDATCPLVTKVHMEVVRYARDDFDVVLIGHAGHPEVEGTMGRFDGAAGGQIQLIETEDDVARLQSRDEARMAFVTQTTLSMDDTARIIGVLRTRFPDIVGPRNEDICYATQNRQDAVKGLASRCDRLLVVGSANSSNSNRLREIAEQQGVASRLIDDADDLERAWLDGCATIGITAGASAPESLVQAVVARLIEWGGRLAEEVAGREENIVFVLPKRLRRPNSTDASA